VKRKSARCSTGHGTGVLQEASLRVRLQHGSVRLHTGALMSERELKLRDRALAKLRRGRVA